MKKIYAQPSIEWTTIEEEQMICESIDKSEESAKEQFGMDAKDRVDFSSDSDWGF